MNRHQFRIKWLVYIILIILMITLSELGFSFYHEGVHGAIFNQYGVNYTYGFMFDPDMFYTPAFYTKTTDSSFQLCNEICGSLQTENEIISYNMHAISYTLWSIFLFLIFMVYVNEESKLKEKEETQYDYQD